MAETTNAKKKANAAPRVRGIFVCRRLETHTHNRHDDFALLVAVVAVFHLYRQLLLCFTCTGCCFCVSFVQAVVAVFPVKGKPVK